MQTCQTTMRLPQLVIDTIREISNRKDLELFLTEEMSNVVGAKQLNN